MIEGYTDLNLWHLDNIEVVYLRMSDAKTVDLPCDYVDYLKIGIPINGHIRVLTKNDRMLLPRKFADGEDVGNTDAGSIDYTSAPIYFIDHFRNGQFVGGLYGMPGAVDEAYYRIDRENRQIIFTGSIPRGEVVLEYVSSGIDLGGTTVIPREAVPALRAFALWQIIENDSKVGGGEKERKKAQYEEQVEALRAFQNTFTADEYRRHVYRHSRQSPKR